MKPVTHLILATGLTVAMAGIAHAQTATAVPSAEFPYESNFVEVDGANIHYVEQGEGSPILFLHGNPTSSYLWRNIIPYVSDQGRAIAIDLVGFGQSDKVDDAYTFQDHYSYVEGFIEEMGLRRRNLGGARLGLGPGPLLCRQPLRQCRRRRLHGGTDPAGVSNAVAGGYGAL